MEAKQQHKHSGERIERYTNINHESKTGAETHGAVEEGEATTTTTKTPPIKHLTK